MIFGKVAKTLIALSLAGAASVIAWPKLADYIYPDGSKQAANFRNQLPDSIKSALPDHPAAGQAKSSRIAGRGPGARRGPGAGRGPGARGRPGGRPGAGRPGAGKPGAAASRRGGKRGRGGRKRGPRRPVPVTVGKTTIGEVPFLFQTLGTARAFATVNLKTRVDSTIQKIHVPDGAKVKAGDILVQLDPRQMQAQIRQAEATIAKDDAENRQAKRETKRYSELFSRRSGTRINVENARLKIATTAATMAANKAQLENLKVQLSYYTIRAPISGRIGIVNSKAGNTIRAGDNSATGILMTIIQASPIYISFSMPQSYLGQLREAITSGKGEVVAKPQGSKRSVKGKLSLIENAVDTTTGTVTVHAVFENKDEFLWPGQLCDLRVILRRDQNIVSIPREALRSGQNGNFVFAVDQGVAKVKPVKVLRAQEGREIIASGLKGDEIVVIEGALSLRNGSRVQVRNNPDKRDS